MELRIKEVCRAKKMPLKRLAEKLGISRQSLDKRITRNPKWSSIVEIAEALGVDVMELMEPSPGYVHFYFGEIWMGINRKD